MLPNLTVTSAAEKFMRRMVRFSGLPSGAGFRLLVNSGGCSGYDAGFSAVTEAQPGDEAMEINGLRLFLPAESRLLLDGVTIDFVDTPDRSGFAFVKDNHGPDVAPSAGEHSVTRVDVGRIGHGRPLLPPPVS
ncbi:HesB/YadR/YfhF-family protein [Paraburkholderia piptadeniae]|uniref:HesB/YadR/YfhF-family protein n=1 Tax=Paraburkholderia piptadeniae TaxID=1701573 RepID=A0A1N7SXW0_9BURK|nr:iron-sulfur cluster assembly accessory protein [Paraburkholderia piptadeniae]SIT52229.1 HesB/YadR/YfhF-family protein [Paraburkholderia piptadeniae]